MKYIINGNYQDRNYAANREPITFENGRNELDITISNDLIFDWYIDAGVSKTKIKFQKLRTFRIRL